MLALSATDVWSGLLLLALSLLLLPAVLMPALLSGVTMASGFRPLSLLTTDGVPGPMPQVTWLLLVPLAGGAWVVAREVQRRAALRAEEDGLLEPATRRKPAPAECMVSVFGTPELWSSAKPARKERRFWRAEESRSERRQEVQEPAQAAEPEPRYEPEPPRFESVEAPVRARRSFLRGISWNWRRPWTIVLSPEVQPDVGPVQGTDPVWDQPEVTGQEEPEAGADYEYASQPESSPCPSLGIYSVEMEGATESMEPDGYAPAGAEESPAAPGYPVR